MARCEVCGNDYGMTFEVHAQGAVHVFDCFSCAIHRMAPICEHCRVQIIGQGVEVDGHWYCGAHCARAEGKARHRRQGRDRVDRRRVRPPRPEAIPTELYRRGVYRFLLSRQWVILTLVALVLIPTMIRLGFWQLHRHEHQVAQNQLIADEPPGAARPGRAAHLPRHTVPRNDPVPRGDRDRHFDTAHEVVARAAHRRRRQTVGYHVLTPFVLDDGGTVLVNRGWIPADGDQTAVPQDPRAARRRRLTVTGRLMADETTAASGIKDVQRAAAAPGHADQQRAAGEGAGQATCSAATSS